MFVFLWILGENSIGLTAGSGIEGAGDVDLREELNELRRLGVRSGGFIGRAKVFGVPGVDGTGELSMRDPFKGRSGGAGLPEDTRRAGRSIRAIFPCCERENCPSLVLSA